MYHISLFGSRLKERYNFKWSGESGGTCVSRPLINASRQTVSCPVRDVQSLLTSNPKVRHKSGSFLQRQPGK